ncbi:TPM domain-containing protein [Microbacterium sp. ZW T5_45]|uniref:TPM domain-containing protein n=1 Tax=Microbacterium sp. ZW T5_45 TaxID=3378080 RepID=UPI003852A213
MKTRWLAVGALTLSALVGALSVSAASATSPLPLDPGYVTDDVGVLTAAERQSIEERLQTLSENSQTDLFVVFVDDFTDPTDAAEWADAVAENNSLGTEQYLLAVAVEGRNYYISQPVGGSISDGALDDIEDSMQPLMAQNDWDGAVTLAADEMQGDGGAGALRVVLIIAGIVVLAVVIWLVIAGIRRSRRAAEIRERGAMPEQPDPNDPFSTLTDAQVETQAGSALVQADDALTSSREELGFAVAQFGDAATAEFSAAIETASAKMSEAFDLKQKLDDEVEDSLHDRRAWHIRIITLCEEIDDVLDANTDAFDALRRLEENAPQELDRVRAERAALEQRLPAAAPALAALTAAYDPAELTTVADNPDQARERVALADQSIAAAANAITDSRSGDAAFAIRTAEQAVAQAHQLVDAITSLDSELGALETQSQALIAELQGDLAAARQLPDPTGTIAQAASTTEQQLALAQTNLTGTARSPRRVVAALSAANAQIDGAIAQGRESAERARRAQQMLDQVMAQADSQIRTTREYLETRRASVGSTARTRLSQAESLFGQAVSLRASNPEQALAAAQQAIDLAGQASEHARSDYSSYSVGPGWGSGPYGGSSQGSGGSGLAGDILGGIIGGLISGGGGGSSHRSSGSSWRSTGSRGYRSSGFGGGGGRSSGRSGRSGGRRF